MPYYRDTDNSVHFIESEEFENLLPSGSVLIADNEAVVAPTLDQIKTALCIRIDTASDTARLKIAGDPLRVVEYQRAETEAKAFAAAGYTGTAPPTVTSWAEAKGWTAQAAADDILRASAAWNAALYAFRDIRLKGKEAVKAAIDPAAAQTAADAAIVKIDKILAEVP